VPEKARAEQRASYAALLNSLGHASFDEIEQVMAEREPVAPDKGLNPEAIAQLSSRLAKQHAARKSKRKAT
jgi:hypothetical protein